MFTLSLSLSLSIMMLTALVLPLHRFCERDSGGLFHCGVTTNFIFILISYYPYLHERFARWRKWRAELILQPFRHFTYVTAHSPTLSSLYLRHNSFSNSSVVSPTSQFILQSFFRFYYITGSSLTSPSEPPMHVYVSYKIFAKYSGRHWQKQGSDWLSQVQFFNLSIVKYHPVKIPASVLEKVRSGSCLKLFHIDCSLNIVILLSHYVKDLWAKFGFLY